MPTASNIKINYSRHNHDHYVTTIEHFCQLFGYHSPCGDHFYNTGRKLAVITCKFVTGKLKRINIYSSVFLLLAHGGLDRK